MNTSFRSLETITAPVFVEGSFDQEETSFANSRNRRSHFLCEDASFCSSARILRVDVDSGHFEFIKQNVQEGSPQFTSKSYFVFVIPDSVIGILFLLS